MPIYGYRCTDCGHELEVLQSMSAEPLRVCAECGGGLRKLLYPVGVQFKGSGFYTTDYRNGDSAKSAKSKSDAPSDSTGDAGSSSSAASNGSSSSSEKKTETAASKE